MPIAKQAETEHDSAWDLFRIFLRLGLTSFGGPAAHLAYFREEFVAHRRWLDERSYADLLALCHFLPGPTSSQVGIAVGYQRGGLKGAFCSWLGFTLPSALLLMLFGLGILYTPAPLASGWLHGLKVIAVAIVAYAIWNMGRVLCPDKLRIAIALLAMSVALFFNFAWTQVAIILVAALVGWRLLPQEKPKHSPGMRLDRTSLQGSVYLVIWFVLLISLPILTSITGSPELGFFDKFYRVGSFVFGGGHVVLPLLETEMVRSNLIYREVFLAGYGAAQAIPGPLFTIAAYIGTVAHGSPNGILGGFLALIAIFLPAFLIVLGVLPLWNQLRQSPAIQAAMQGINAAVVGLLLAVFYSPVWAVSIFNTRDFTLAVFAFALLQFWKIPSWGLAILGAVLGQLLYSFG